jgi:tRNA-binding protein
MDKTQTALSQIAIDDFVKVDMRVGTIIHAELNALANKPAYTLKIDFGPLGIKQSSAQITQNYRPEQLAGQKVVAVVNFAPKRIAGVLSEVLVLAALCEKNGTVLVEPSLPAKNGSRIF